MFANIIIKYVDKYLQVLLSSILGMFGVFAFSPYDFWPASIISLTGLFLVILETTWKKAIRNTLFWGIGFFSFGLHWIYIGIAQFINTYSYINILLIILLIIYLSCFPILFSIFFTILQLFMTQWELISIAPILWSITERFRGNIFIGFPWLQFGYTQINGPIKGIAPIFGVEGITFVLIFISGLLALSIKKKQLLPIYISLIILTFTYPLKWIQWYRLQPQRSTHISLIQGNIDHHLNQNITHILPVLQLYLKYTLPILGKTNIIIWPESAIPGNELINNQFLTLLDYHLRQHKTYLITGVIDTVLINNNYYHYNSIIIIGDIIPYTYPSYNRYNKHHLVPFAESFPYQTFFRPLCQFLNIPMYFMKKGDYLQSQLKTGNIKMTAAICYEIILGKQIRDNFKSNSDFLITIANDIWFGHSIGPWQHFQMTRMRALELGRPVLCGTNNGVTAIIRADGSIQSQLPQFVSDILDADVIPTTGLTPYAKFGSSWMFGVIIIFFIYLYYSVKNFYKK